MSRFVTQYYVCSECGIVFDDPAVKRWVERHGAGINEPWAAYVCPVCGSEDFEEIEYGLDED